MENQTFAQLMLTGDECSLSTEQREFVITHKRILSCGRAAGQAFVDLARELQRMRDGKLYRAAGFEEFGEYVESAVGIKQRQAYSYIKVVEEYSEQYIEEHYGYGVTKLALLAQMTEQARGELEEQIDVENASTRELREKIKQLEAEWKDKAILEVKTNIHDVVVPDAVDQVRTSKLYVVREVPKEEWSKVQKEVA